MTVSISIVGAGVVGTNLARAFARAGHEVRFAARNPASEKVVTASDLLGVDVVPLAGAADGADIVVLAVPFDAVASTSAALGDLGSTIVIDATNTVGSALPAEARSVPDVVVAANPTATVVKAFNTIGAEAYLAPRIGEQAIFLPIAGPDGPAAQVRALAATLGFDAVVIGDETTASIVESFAGLWIHLAFRTGLGRDFGFARLQR